MLEVKRTIRSFALREGRMTAAQKHAFATLYQKYGLLPVAAETKPRLDLKAAFAGDAPKVLEIGFGMGDALFEMAEANPHEDYVGVEVHRPGLGHLLQLTEKAELTNLKVIYGDVKGFIDECFAAQTFDRIQVFFPDPWPKKRHHKRRLLQAAFIQQLCHKLKTHGLLHIATDWAPYAESILETLQDNQDLQVYEGKLSYQRPLTKFEQRGINAERAIHDIIYQKR